MNAVEIEAAISELALAPFDGAEFPYAFLAAFGNKDTALKRLRTGNNNTSDQSGGAVLQGVLQRSNIHIAVCAAGTVGNYPDIFGSLIQAVADDTERLEKLFALYASMAAKLVATPQAKSTPKARKGKNV